MDTSKLTMTKCLGNEKKKHKETSNQFFTRLNIVTKDLYEVELVKEYRELFIVRFFILQYAK